MLPAKRTIDINEFETSPMKKIKSDPLAISNSLGLLSPPVTPRKNKVSFLELASTATPSTAFNHTSIEPPKKNVSRQLFSPESPYGKAKSLFLRSCKPSSFVLDGREKEASLLHDQIQNSLLSLTSNSIYVSGPPGTGKTAQVTAILRSFIQQDEENMHPELNICTTCINEEVRRFRVININCMTIHSPEQLFSKIYEKVTGIDKKGASAADVSKILLPDNSCHASILVLDEMDNITNKSQQSLFELFSWASNIKSFSNKPSLILIGIANALDLTDRFLPRLRANRINPQVVQFLPYTAEQINQVITNKLLGLLETETGSPSKVPPMVHPASIMFCAKKSAVNTGDLRRAFDIMHTSLDMFERTVLEKQTVHELQAIPMEKLPKVMISQVAKVCSQAFNTDYQKKLKTLNFQQKILLAFLFKYEEKCREESFLISIKKSRGRSSSKSLEDRSINSFFEYYSKQLKFFDKVVSTLKRGEFLEVLTSLENQSVVTISSVNSTKKVGFKSINSGAISFGSNKVVTYIPRQEFCKCCTEVEILQKIMNNAC
ncbi:AAA family ATPase [Martiniozyma asiatica (nom. inval.)]|nr:AAA family ATPase [Martiniozyma asiatica]